MAKFIEVTCKQCGNNQMIFTNSSQIAKCSKCQNELVKTTGGIAKII